MIDSYTNGLIHETSPYLKQHAHNPVEWYDWGETAFHRATQEDKPIFLSIGYSTCHWCHVMAHESFEDSSIADYLNRHFISIKVDREERPDIDQIYMSVCQSMTGSGGWPLTIVMTPEKKPFFAGTYFPNESRGGRIGLQDLLVRIHEVWVNQRAEIDQTTTEIVNSLRLAQSSAPGPALSIEMAGVAATEMADHFDPEFGGFREAPKFPGPHNLLFLLQHTHLTGDPTFQAMALKTLTEMRLGGLYDQVGGGFHRYSTDRKWHLPHFEKMLYDQALLLMAYADAYSISGDDLYRRTIVDTISYITRDLGAESGGFYSAEDADSDGGEGKFYTWTTAEISQIVTPERFRQLRDDFSLADSGNFLDEHAHHSTGLNILHLATTPEKLADRFHISTEQWWEDWNRDRDALRQAREKRVRPGLDNKILTDWNGLTIAALSKAARALENPENATLARLAADFVLENLRTENGTLEHRHTKGNDRIPGFLDDYSDLIWGLRELYETIFDPYYLAAAIELQKVQNRLFWDQTNGGYFLTSNEGETLITRQKEVYDGARPSGNSVSAANLFYLARMTGNSEWEAMVGKIGAAFSAQVRRVPSAFSGLLSAIAVSQSEFQEIVVVGDPNNSETRQMLREVQRGYDPCKVILFKDPKDQKMATLAPYTADYRAINGQPTAYICKNHACLAPVVGAKNLHNVWKKRLSRRE